jgi:hypothetical protein
MDWSTKKFTYRIVNQHGETLGHVHKFLSELEDFAIKSGMRIKGLERKGPDNFIVEVITGPGWKI